jgi:hypothetical protein
MNTGAVLVGFVEELAQIHRQAPETSLCIEERLEEKARSRCGATDRASGSRAIAQNGTRHVRAVPVWISGVAGATEGHDANDATGKVWVLVIQTGVGNRHDLAHSGFANPGVWIVLVNGEETAGVVIVDFWGDVFLEGGYFGQSRNIEKLR